MPDNGSNNTNSQSDQSQDYSGLSDSALKSQIKASYGAGVGPGSAYQNFQNELLRRTGLSIPPSPGSQSTQQPSQPAPPQDLYQGRSTGPDERATVPMFGPDGSIADIPRERAQDAAKDGYKLSQSMLGPDGSIADIPLDRVPDAMKGGYKLTGENRLYGVQGLPKPPRSLKDILAPGGEVIVGGLKGLAANLTKPQLPIGISKQASAEDVNAALARQSNTRNLMPPGATVPQTPGEKAGYYTETALESFLPLKKAIAAGGAGIIPMYNKIAALYRNAEPLTKLLIRAGIEVGGVAGVLRYLKAASGKNL